MNQEIVGKTIKENRLKLKLTQSELGEKLGVTYKTISRWENGNYMPDISLLIPLCKELNISLNELLDSDTPAENIIEVAQKDINNKKKIIIILLITLFIMGIKIFIDNYYKNIKYDNSKIYCEILDDKVNVVFKNYSPFIYTSNIIEDDENEYIFVNGSYNYDGIKKYSEKYVNNNIYIEEVKNNKKIYVYYTNYNNVFSNNLDNSINNSTLICSK